MTAGLDTSRRSPLFAERLRRVIGSASVVALVAFAMVPSPASAQSLTDALASTYNTNPELNAGRAQLRSTDEGVPQALSGNRPQLFGSVSGAVGALNNRSSNGTSSYSTVPVTIGVQLTQPIFDGFQTPNAVRQAEAAVRAEREVLRNTEQSVLLSAATAFVDVIQGEALVELQQSNLQFLDEQVKASKDRFQVGEGTNTDVAQAEASRAQAEASLNSAKATLQAARATFRQVTGLEAKTLRLQPLGDGLKPKSLEAGLTLGQKRHPAINAAAQNVDVAGFNVKVLEGQTLPQLNMTAGAQREYDFGTAGEGRNRSWQTDSAQVGLNLSIPLYQAGLPSSQIRQAKEQLGFARIQVDLNRDLVRSQIVSAWGNLQAAEASIYAARTSVVANQLAVNGVIEEQKVGQATTLDVLLQQSNLIDARTTLVQAEHDRVVALYSLISATGQLDSKSLKLPVKVYNPTQHYEAVRDSWGGLRTPDGR